MYHRKSQMGPLHLILDIDGVLTAELDNKRIQDSYTFEHVKKRLPQFYNELCVKDSIVFDVTYNHRKRSLRSFYQPRNHRVLTISH